MRFRPRREQTTDEQDLARRPQNPERAAVRRTIGGPLPMHQEERFLGD